MNKIVHYADFVDAIRSFFWVDTQGSGREIQWSTHRAIKSFPPTNFGGDFSIYLLPIPFCSLMMMMTTMVRLYYPFTLFNQKLVVHLIFKLFYIITTYSEMLWSKWEGGFYIILFWNSIVNCNIFLDIRWG